MATFNWRRDYSRYRHYLVNIIALYQKREDIRAFLGILLSLATISVLGLFALRPTLVTIGSLTSRIREKEETIQKLDQKINALRQAQEAKSRQSANISLLTEAIPDNSSPHTFYPQVEGLSTRNQVGLVTYSIDKAVVKGVSSGQGDRPSGSNIAGEQYLTGSFSFASDYQSIQRFMLELENMIRPAEITDYTLGPKAGEEQLVGLILNIKVPYLDSSSNTLDSSSTTPETSGGSQNTQSTQTPNGQ